MITQLCQTPCNFMDCSPPGSSVHGILQGKNIGVGCHFYWGGLIGLGFPARCNRKIQTNFLVSPIDRYIDTHTYTRIYIFILKYIFIFIYTWLSYDLIYMSY